jgi:hypothetical protein
VNGVADGSSQCQRVAWAVQQQTCWARCDTNNREALSQQHASGGLASRSFLIGEALVARNDIMAISGRAISGDENKCSAA